MKTYKAVVMSGDTFVFKTEFTLKQLRLFMVTTKTMILGCKVVRSERVESIEEYKGNIKKEIPGRICEGEMKWAIDCHPS